MKTGWLALSLVALASTGEVLTARSAISFNESQAPNTSTPNTVDIQGMQHHGSDMEQGNPSAPDAGGMQNMEPGSGMMNHNMTMDLGPADANYDLRFIDAMRLHHRGAIAMAKEAEQKSQRPEIKKLARNIIIAQTREENELLRKWRKAWYPQASTESVTYGGSGKSVVPMSEQQQQSMSMLKDLGPADAKFDLRFMNAMIEHHEGATNMAQDALSKSKRPEVKKLAQEILTSQQAEINQMKQWRKAWYKK